MVFIREPKNRKGKRVLLRNLVFMVNILMYSKTGLQRRALRLEPCLSTSPDCLERKKPQTNEARFNIGALIVRIGLWGRFYFIPHKEPHNSIGNHLGPYIRVSWVWG